MGGIVFTKSQLSAETADVSETKCNSISWHWALLMFYINV